MNNWQYKFQLEDEDTEDLFERDTLDEAILFARKRLQERLANSYVIWKGSVLCMQVRRKSDGEIVETVLNRI